MTVSSSHSERAGPQPAPRPDAVRNWRPRSATSAPTGNGPDWEPGTSRAYLQDTVDAPAPVTTLDGPIPRSSRPFEDSGERAGPVGTGA